MVIGENEKMIKYGPYDIILRNGIPEKAYFGAIEMSRAAAAALLDEMEEEEAAESVSRYPL